MPTLQTQLQSRLQGRLCLAGVGDPTAGDDGLGVTLATLLAPLQTPTVIVHHAGTRPETTLAIVEEHHIDSVLFLDAVHFGASPGAVILLDPPEIVSRYPPVSTHKLSLGLLAQLLSANGPSHVALLGVQPASLRPGTRLSPEIATTLEALARLLTEVLANRHRDEGHHARREPHAHPLTPLPSPTPCT